MKNKRKFSRGKFFIFIACMAISFGAAALGSLFTASAVKSDWYSSIKPAITPPNFVFPIVWTILFFLMGLSLYSLWIKANRDMRRVVGVVFGFNFLLNILWSVLYFGMRNPLFAFIEIIVLWLSIATMIYAAWKVDKKAAWMLVPYLVWVSFAAVLNYLSI